MAWVIVGAIAPRRLRLCARVQLGPGERSGLEETAQGLLASLSGSRSPRLRARFLGVLKGLPTQRRTATTSVRRIARGLTQLSVAGVRSGKSRASVQEPAEDRRIRGTDSQKQCARFNPALCTTSLPNSARRATAAWAQFEKLDSAQRISWLGASLVAAGKHRSSSQTPAVSIGRTNSPFKHSSTRKSSPRNGARSLLCLVISCAVIAFPGSQDPVVIGLAQEGQAGFLKHHAELIDQLLNEGVTVFLLMCEARVRPVRVFREGARVRILRCPQANSCWAGPR